MRRSRWIAIALAVVALPVLVGISELAGRAKSGGDSATARSSGERGVFAASMRGTQPDGRLSVRQGNLEPSPELLRVFDYYLSALGEKSLQEITTAIGEDLRSRLSSSPAALAQAKHLLGRYLGYRQALLALHQAEAVAAADGKPTSVRLQARLERARELRAQFFSEAEAAAFFRLDDLRDVDAVRRLEIFESTRLTLAEKKAAYAELDLNLPEPLREEREAPRRIQNVEQQVAGIRAAGASEQEVFQFRSLQFSVDAAYRLQQLDREQQFWASRIQQYDAEVRRLLQLPDGPLRIPASLTPAQQATLDDLRARLFTPQERRRLAAYEVRD